MSHGSLVKPRRIIDRKYREWVEAQGCFAHWAVTTRKLGTHLPAFQACAGPIDPHHAIEKGQGRIGSKVSDRECISACRTHHELAELSPSLFRELFQDIKVRLNAEYDLAKPKPVRERKKHGKARISIQNCAACHGSHPKLSKLKVQDINLALGRITFMCPIKNQTTSATI